MRSEDNFKADEHTMSPVCRESVQNFALSVKTLKPMEENMFMICGPITQLIIYDTMP